MWVSVSMQKYEDKYMQVCRYASMKVCIHAKALKTCLYTSCAALESNSLLSLSLSKTLSDFNASKKDKRPPSS